MDILQIIKNLEARLWTQYGNPLACYKQTQDDIHMTYYVGKLMEESGHQYVRPERISGSNKEDRVYFSEKALHDAFLAGRLIERKEMKSLREIIKKELKEDLKDQLESL
jgi:hypothetical protein